MTKSFLLDKFIEDADDPLLEALLKVYIQNLEASDEERLNRLVAKLEEKFEEQINEAYST